MKNKLLNQIKAMCQEEIDINNNSDTHFSKITDGTEGICEGRLEFAEGLLEFINRSYTSPINGSDKVMDLYLEDSH